MDMLEQVAEAVYRKFEDRPAYAQLQMNGLLAQEIAIAAIEAMREPTEEMCEFAEDNFDRNGDPIAVCHRAMITAILKSTRETP